MSVSVLFVFVRHAHPPVPLRLCDVGSSVPLGAAEGDAARRAIVDVTLSAVELTAQPDYDALHGGRRGLRRPLKWRPQSDVALTFQPCT